MCRVAAYVGPPVALSELLYATPHSLERQSYAPREMVSGHVNVDGTGVAWWRRGEESPMRYVSPLPPWSDPNLPSLAPRLSGSPILAVVRSQTPGMPAGVSSTHPFVSGSIAGAHNGYIEGFREARWRMLEWVDEETRAGVEALTDSEFLFLLAASKLREDPGRTLSEAATQAVDAVAGWSMESGAVASLNLFLASSRFGQTLPQEVV